MIPGSKNSGTVEKPTVLGFFNNIYFIFKKVFFFLIWNSKVRHHDRRRSLVSWPFDSLSRSAGLTMNSWPFNLLSWSAGLTMNYDALFSEKDENTPNVDVILVMHKLAYLTYMMSVCLFMEEHKLFHKLMLLLVQVWYLLHNAYLLSVWSAQGHQAQFQLWELDKYLTTSFKF